MECAISARNANDVLIPIEIFLLAPTEKQAQDM